MSISFSWSLRDVYTTLRASTIATPIKTNNIMENARMNSSPKTFLVCHGAWSAGWAWKKMHPLMNKAGHRLVTPTYTGLGERAHVAHPAIDLETHVTDMLQDIKYEYFRDFAMGGPAYDVLWDA